MNNKTELASRNSDGNTGVTAFLLRLTLIIIIS